MGIDVRQYALSNTDVMRVACVGRGMSAHVCPRDRPVQAKYYLPESNVERVKAQAEKMGVSQSALVAECLAESL